MPPSTLPTIDEITENFAFFDAWDDRFAYLIDLGKKLPELPEPYTTDAHRVHGCQSSVWMHLGLNDQAEPPTVELLAKSDAHIVNGLIAILLSLYHGGTVDHALTADAESLMQELGLEEHLSPTRRNGLHAMIERVRALAKTKQN